MNYSIAALGQLSGLSTHTIRKWEQRYGALSPLRSSGNTRSYADEQLKRLLNLVSLTERGLPISKACTLSEKEIDNYLEPETGSADDRSSFEYYLSRLIVAGLNYQEYAIHRLFDECIAAWGVAQTYQQVMYPLLVRLGMMWQRDRLCPAHEHFLSAIIRQKIIAATEDLSPVKEAGPGWLLFLPEDEDHEIGLLFANYMLRLHQQKVIYLGAKVPLHNVEDILHSLKISHLLFFMTRKRPGSDAKNYLRAVASVAGDTSICTAGNQKLLAGVPAGHAFSLLQTLADLEEKINKNRYDC